MLCLSDFVTCRKRYYNQSGRGVYISAMKHCRKMKFRTYLHLTLNKHNFYVVTVYCYIMILAFDLEKTTILCFVRQR